MTTQAEFASLAQLRLNDHGDALERFYWPVVSVSIPSYEFFWRNFIVLLTNRVDPSALDDWIRVRSGLPEEYERLLMANYSTFYNIVVARAQLAVGSNEIAERRFYHPESFFFFARACIENFVDLKRRAQKLLSGGGVRCKLPGISDALMHEVKSYRDVFAHKSHLGRGSHYGRGMILKRDHLPKPDSESVLLWSQSDSLSIGDMTDTLHLQLDLWNKLAGVLESTWCKLAEGFEEFRVTEPFLKVADLERFLPIHGTVGSKVIPSATNSVAASGTQVFPELARN